MTGTVRRDLALSESGVAGIGLACILAGFVGTGVPGVARLLVALGVGLTLAGTVYVATDGPTWLRFGLPFVALVAAQLCFFGGVVRWLGAIGVVIVVAGVAYSLR